MSAVEHATPTATPAPTQHTRTSLIGLLALSKAADAGVTAYGMHAGLVERSPLAAGLMDLLGIVPGLVIGSILVLATVVGVVEWGQRHFRSPASRHYTRAGAYGLLIVWFAGAAGYNYALIGGGVA